MERPRILAVLNCFGESGANIGQMAIYADGTVKPFNDFSFIRGAMKILRSHALTPFMHADDRGFTGRVITTTVCDAPAAPSFLISNKTPRKASCSAPAVTADGTE